MPLKYVLEKFMSLGDVGEKLGNMLQPGNEAHNVRIAQFAELFQRNHKKYIASLFTCNANVD
jgi:hypothetical protein